MNVSSLVEPAFCTVPDYHQTFGGDVAELSTMAGFPPDPEQRLGLDGIFAVNRRGLSVAFETAVIACRQNLKTGLLKQAVLGWLFVTDERLVVWSAHEFRTAQEAFRDLEELVTGCDVLRRRVKSIYRGNGDEAIELTTGARLIFKTRTRGGGRGLSGRKVVLDEGMFLRPMHMGALLPTLSAQPDPQVVYAASAGLTDSAVLRGVRDRGRAGDPRLAYYEWCAPSPVQVCEAGAQCTHRLDVAGCGCDDPANWQRGNPAMDRIRIFNGQPAKVLTREYIAAERRALPPAEFGRERMGWWDDPAEDAHPFPVQAWSKRVDATAPRPERPALAIAITRDRSAAAIGSAGRVGDLTHVDVHDHRAGTGWIVDRAVDLYDKAGACVLVLDPSGPAGALEPELIARGFSTKPGEGARLLKIVTAREYAQGCGAFVDDVVNDRLRHRDRRELNAAARSVRTRPLADAYAWSRKDSAADISPLETVTLARLGLATYVEEEAVVPWAVYG